MQTTSTIPIITYDEQLSDNVPPLQNGDHLTGAEFMRRYEAAFDINKAELVEGVVFMPSPVSLKHGEVHGDVMAWLGAYKAATPNVRLADNITVLLDSDNMAQPDAVLFIDEQAGGRTTIKGRYLAGPPELIVEVAASSAAYDLYNKLHVYRRNGVQEYLVLSLYERETRWFQLVEGDYRPLPMSESGLMQSHIFPGLHFRPSLLWAADLAALLKVLQVGSEFTNASDLLRPLTQLG